MSQLTPITIETTINVPIKKIWQVSLDNFKKDAEMV
jgi:hypothetical protein